MIFIAKYQGWIQCDPLYSITMKSTLIFGLCQNWNETFRAKFTNVSLDAYRDVIKQFTMLKQTNYIWIHMNCCIVWPIDGEPKIRIKRNHIHTIFRIELKEALYKCTLMTEIWFGIEFTIRFIFTRLMTC